MINVSHVDAYLDDHLTQSIDELSRLVSQPSVSAQNWGVKECADLVAEMIARRGFKVNIFGTGSAPVVFGERPGKSKKTLIFYNHYDVQPAEPLELWESPPFVPTMRDGKLFGRGVSDNKADIANRLFAIDALLAVDGELPCRVKWVIEGEEETSSMHLQGFVADHLELLKADSCIWESGGVDHEDHPTQHLGMRGICYIELSVETASQDAHSGLGGSIFPNAAWRLVWALQSIKGPDEHIRIPGFYDKVRAPSKRDIELMKAMPETANEYRRRYGLKKFLGGLTGGVELRLAAVFQPTCTICGLTSGYQGPGSKTVLPAKASAKVDFRLVPDQSPDDVVRLLRAHLDAEGFEDVQITYLGGEAPARTDPDDPFVKLVVDTSKEVYGVPMQIVPMIGGSGPIHLFREMLNVPVVSAGTGYPGSQAHAPNENLRIDLYLRAARMITRILSNFGQT